MTARYGRLRHQTAGGIRFGFAGSRLDFGDGKLTVSGSFSGGLLEDNWLSLRRLFCYCCAEWRTASLTLANMDACMVEEAGILRYVLTKS